METKQISKAVIKRLPRYYRYLGELMEDNVERISSNELSKKMHTTASQIRQDLFVQEDSFYDFIMSEYMQDIWRKCYFLVN